MGFFDIGYMDYENKSLLWIVLAIILITYVYGFVCSWILLKLDDKFKIMDNDFYLSSYYAITCLVYMIFLFIIV